MILTVFLLSAAAICSCDATPLRENQNDLKALPSSIDYEKVALSFIHLLELQTTYRYKSSVNVDECVVCKDAVVAIKDAAKAGLKPNEISFVADLICNIAKIEDKAVCDGMTREYQDEIVISLTRTPLSDEDVCVIFVGGACGNPVGPDFNWTIPLTPKPPAPLVKLPTAGAPTLRVLHLSDIHIDRLYQAGAPADCTEPLCCRNISTPQGDNPKKAEKWGHYGSCDTPIPTFENLLQHVSKEKFDYVIWTGDLPAHDVWMQSRDEQLALLSNLTSYFKTYLPGTRIFPALGNHESAPVDSFPPPYITGKDSVSWLYTALATDWSPWLPTDTVETIQRGGYYTTLVSPGFRMVSLNMNYCNGNNWWMLINMTDPTGELTWLAQVLERAEHDHEKVHIIGHIPPGSCLRMWSWNYNNIIERYEDVITAQFFGHTHKDEFEISYVGDRTSGILYIGPSVTTFGSLNPGYRVYDIDGDRDNTTRLVLDHSTYIMNLTDANLSDDPKWELEYSAKKAYNMTSLLPQEWDKLVQQFETDDDLFQTYYKYYHKSAPSDPCDKNCRDSQLCDLRSARAGDRRHCKHGINYIPPRPLC